MKRRLNAGTDEPNKKEFLKPSEKEHLFQVVDVFDIENNPYNLSLDETTVTVKLEVCEGEELGRSLLQRLSLDDKWKGFFATRIFLKAIGEPYKGEIEIDTAMWVGRQFYATVVHNDGYANISEYNFDKKVDQISKPTKLSPEEIIAWDE